MSTIHTIDFGKSYEDESRKKFLGWIWRCGCDKCRKLPGHGYHGGPFKTRRAAERDVEQCLTLMHCDPVGSA